MSEIISDKKVFTLLEVTLSIQKTLTERYSTSFWVKAEMNKLNHYTHSGHCYPELVEKRNGKVIAQIKSNLWKDDYQRINRQFLQVLKEPIKDGVQILFRATIQFDPSHGLSLRILDIDPIFSLGELEREKQETIDRLNTEGIFHQNKKLKLPLLPQRIAVISVETSKGYSDYLKIIEHNPWGYRFYNFLFPSLLQGERSVISIMGQLKRIRKVVEHFDAVAIIRGGGGDVGLSSYNNYNLVKEIALFPIPVITGIGHSTNETVTEMVSFKNAITPTELADFLIQKFHNFAVPVKRAEEIIVDRAKRILSDESQKFHHMIRYLQSVTHNRLLRHHNNIEGMATALTQQTKFLLKKEHHLFEGIAQSIRKHTPALLAEHKQQLMDVTSELRQHSVSLLSDKKQSLVTLEKNVAILDPINILKRGFTLTLDKDGRSIKNAGQVKAGDTITTVLADGTLISKVEESKKAD
jgi:exodeoxyribonuclease VII large subunit